MNALTSKQTTSMPAVAPSFANMLKEGHGEDMTRALIDSIEYYVGYLASVDMTITERDSINIYTLTQMLRGVLKDHSGIDTE